MINRTTDTLYTQTVIEDKRCQIRAKQKWKRVLLKVANIISKIFLGIVHLACILAFPNLYALTFGLSFVIDCIWGKKVGLVIEKIRVLLEKKPWILGIIAIPSFFTLQWTVVGASMLLAAQLGSYAAKMARDLIHKLKRKRKKKPMPPFNLIDVALDTTRKDSYFRGWKAAKARCR